MRVLLDACVLYPTFLRGVLLGAAEAGLFVPLWSPRILEEWRRAVLRHHPLQGTQAAAEIALAQASWPGAMVPIGSEPPTIVGLPDPDDEHVLASAVAGQADILLTLNLKDFPPAALQRQGIMLRDPDTLLIEFWNGAPDRLLPVIASGLAGCPGEDTPGKVLKRARLPRLGKLLDREGAF